MDTAPPLGLPDEWLPLWNQCVAEFSTDSSLLADAWCGLRDLIEAGVPSYPGIFHPPFKAFLGSRMIWRWGDPINPCVLSWSPYVLNWHLTLFETDSCQHTRADRFDQLDNTIIIAWKRRLAAQALPGPIQ